MLFRFGPLLAESGFESVIRDFFIVASTVATSDTDFKFRVAVNACGDLQIVDPSERIGAIFLTEALGDDPDRRFDLWPSEGFSFPACDDLLSDGASLERPFFASSRLLYSPRGNEITRPGD